MRMMQPESETAAWEAQGRNDMTKKERQENDLLAFVTGEELPEEVTHPEVRSKKKSLDLGWSPKSSSVSATSVSSTTYTLDMRF